MVLEEERGVGGENSPAFPLGLSVTADAPSFLLSPFLPPPPPPPPCRKLMGRRRVGGYGIRQTFGCTRGFLLNTIKYSSRFIHQYKKVYSEKIRKTQLHKSLVC